MTETIFNLLRPRVKPLPNPLHERASTTARGTAIRLGDHEREMNEWRDSYSFRTGRAA